MFFTHLLLAHLIGDFILQPTRLVQWKIKSRWGTLVHVLIHAALMFILLMPYIIYSALAIIITIFTITALHFLIDETKISYDLQHDKKVMPFVLDQIFHTAVIIGAYFLLKDWLPAFPETVFHQIYNNGNILNFLLLMIFSTQFIEIYRFQKKREKNRNAILRISSPEITKRIVIITIMYIVFMIFSYSTSQGYVNVLSP